MRESGSNTHAQRAVLTLREQIVNGTLPGGTRLFEVSLAEDLNISRTPVREAMSRLAEEGLLERLPNGGFAVRLFGYADVVDAIELRGTLEGMCARLAAERGVDPAAMAAIEQVAEALEGCFDADGNGMDFDAYAELNAVFHQHLAQLAGSDLLAREVQRVSALPFASPSAYVSNRIDRAYQLRLRTAQDQHLAILDAIRMREGARAEALAREHARVARGRIDHIIGEAPELMERIAILSR